MPTEREGDLWLLHRLVGMCRHPGRPLQGAPQSRDCEVLHSVGEIFVPNDMCVCTCMRPLLLLGHFQVGQGEPDWGAVPYSDRRARPIAGVAGEDEGV